MRLLHLKLQHFRNHHNSVFEFGDGVNVLSGDNGQGKTNVIEAISYLCLTKSFYAASDSLTLNFNEELFEIEGTLAFEHGFACDLRVAYSRLQNEKIYIINKKHVEPFSSIIGRFPVVICSPEHSPITSAGPSERRRFVDFVISQSNTLYFQQLMEYRRVLRHRNKLLFEAKMSRSAPDDLLEPWDEHLVSCGSSIMYRRNQFVKEFHQYIASAYQHLIGTEEEPLIQYRPAVSLSPDINESDIARAMRDELQEKRGEEKRYGTSLVGPHRDEFSLTVNGLDLRKFASQGQHKTFLVAMKIAEFYYLKDRCNETPILLLDDIFSELDEHRAARLLYFVREMSQTFITSTNSHFFDGVLSFGERDRRFSIQAGSVVEQQPVTAS